MVIFLFLIFGLLAALFIKKQYGWLAGFVLVYYRILTTVFFVEGRESLNSIVLLLLYVVIIVGHIFTTRIRPLKYYQSPVFLSTISLVFVMYIHNIISPYYFSHTVEISEVQTSFMINVIFPFILLPFFIQGSKELKSFSDSLIFWGLVYFILLLFVFGFNPEILLSRELVAEQTDELVGTILLSRFAALTVIAIALKILMASISAKKKYLMGILLIISVFVMLIAGQRGTLIGTVLALMLLTIRKDSRKYILILSPVFLFFVIFASYFELEIFERFQQFEELESFNRYHDYYAVWDIFNENNFLWGLGTNGYLYKTGRIYPHNLILDSIASYGLLGLICTLILIICCFKYLLYIIKNAKGYYEVFIACSWVMLCFSSMVSGSFSAHRHFYVFSGLLFMVYRNLKSLQRQRHFNIV